MSSALPPLFTFDGVRLDVGGACLLDGIDLTVPQGAVVVIAGPSGAGKSTLLRLCNRLEVPSAGTVRFRGSDVNDLEPRSLRRRVGMVFQRPTPFAGSVMDNLRVAVADLEVDSAVELLASVRLGADLLDRDAASLSGGECQRVCLARTLATRPEVILMDEPTSALDEPNRLALERLTRELVDGGVSVLWVSHDREQIERIADEVVTLEAGRVVGP